MRGRTHIYCMVWMLAHAALAEETVDSVPMGPVKVYGSRKRAVQIPSELPADTVDVSTSGETSLGRILRHSPSVAPRTSGGEGNETSFLIRGQDPVQNRFFLEGVPLTDAGFNGSLTKMITLESLSDVEIYPQGVPVFFASDGLSGALNLRLPSGEDLKPWGALGRIGSFEYRRVFGTGSVPSLRSRLALDYTRSNEDFRYLDDHGTPFNLEDDSIKNRANNQFQRFSGLFQSELQRNAKSEIRGFLLGGVEELGIPGTIQNPSQASLREIDLVVAGLARVQLSPAWNLDSHLYGKGLSQRLANQGASNGLVPNEITAYGTGAKVAALGNVSSGIDLGAVGAVNWESFFRKSATVDAEAGKNRIDVALGLHSRFDGGDFGELTPAVLAQGFFYDLRGSSNVQGLLEVGSPQRDFLLLSPRVGYQNRPHKQVRLRSSVGIFYRAPTLNELFGNPVGLTPAPQLKTERATKADLGLDWEYREPKSFVRELRFSATVHAARASDLIIPVPNGLQFFISTNIGESLIYGQEVAAELKTAWDVNLRTSASLMQTENLSDLSFARGKDLPGRPSYRVVSTIAVEKPSWELAYVATWVGPMYWDVLNSKRMVAVLEHSLSFTLRTASLGSIGLEARNLLDTISSESSLGALPTVDNTTGYSGYPAPGRRILLTWKYDL